MKTSFSVLLLFWFISLSDTYSQTVISGNVTSQKKETLPGVNVILVDTHDGTTTDLDGNFSFTTYEEGTFQLQFSFIGYVTFIDTIQLPSDSLEVNVGSPRIRTVSLMNKFTEYDTKKIHIELQDQSGS